MKVFKKFSTKKPWTEQNTVSTDHKYFDKNLLQTLVEVIYFEYIYIMSAEHKGGNVIAIHLWPLVHMRALQRTNNLSDQSLRFGCRLFLKR